MSRTEDSSRYLNLKVGIWRRQWRAAMMLAIATAFCGCAIGGAYYWSQTSPQIRKATGQYMKASALFFAKTVPIQHADKIVHIPPKDITSSPQIKTAWQKSLTVIERAAIVAGVSAGLLYLVVFLLTAWGGRKLREDRTLRGASLAPDKKLARRLRRKKRASDLMIGQIPMLAGSETSHILIAGAPGTGKSVQMHAFLDQARKRRQRAIIHDPAGEFVAAHWQEGDVVLNPYDSRCPYWTPWAEMQSAADADRLARAIIPHQKSSDPYWQDAARMLLSAALRRMAGAASLPELMRVLLTTDLSELAALVQGTEAAALLGEGVEKMALSVRATMATYVRALSTLPAYNPERPRFSFRHWAEDEGNGWVYLTSRADQRAALRPLLSCWVDCAAASILSQAPDRERRLWLVLDELPALQKMPSVQSLLAEGRKFGTVGIAGVQSVAQLRGLYGRDDAEAMLGLLSTKVIFRAPDPETAKWSSAALGESERLRQDESFTVSAGSTWHGAQYAPRRVTEHVVLAAEIEQLADLHCYVRLPGDYPVAETHLEIVEREPCGKSLIPRAEEPIMPPAPVVPPVVEPKELSQPKVSKPEPNEIGRSLGDDMLF